MTLALALLELGALLIYAALTGKSVRHLLTGNSTVPATPGALDQGAGS